MHEPVTLSQAAAEVINGKLDDRDWDASEAARRAGVDRVKVWRMLTGVTKKMDLDTFDALAQALGMDPSALMHEVRAYQRADSDRSADPQTTADSVVESQSPEVQAILRQAREDLRPKFNAPDRRRSNGS